MEIKDFLIFYKSNSFIQGLAETIKPNHNCRLKIRGLVGSLDSVVAASVYSINHQNHVFIMHDKEEAAYFFNDLENLLPEKNILFFPASYKRDYKLEKNKNANILQRAETLSRINNKASTGELIVTYPEALSEKVINKKSLKENTFNAKVGDRLDMVSFEELLSTYGFDKSDFVYEAGQFSIRGGIIDVFSYAHDLPYRLEFFGNEIESIRRFDPVTQLSEEDLKSINIIPNLQTKLGLEEQQSFFEFLPKSSKLWIKDIMFTYDIVGKHFEKAIINFNQALEEAEKKEVTLPPDTLFESIETFKNHTASFPIIEFGNRFSSVKAEEIDFEAKPQPSFNKDFVLLSNTLIKNEQSKLTNIIAAELPKQHDRLQTIFEELQPNLSFHPLVIGLRAGFIDPILQIACYTDHQIFERFHRYKTKDTHSKSRAITLKELKMLSVGNYVTHIDYGIGRFAGLNKVRVGTKFQEAVRLIYKDNDILYVSIHSIHKISKYTGREDTPPAMNKLGSAEWDNKKKKTRSKVADIARDLIKLYAKRKKITGFAFSPDSFMQAELELSFIYEDTLDQAKAAQDVKNDMELDHPMDRLVCGDVGFGKTEVAIRAIFKAVSDSKQVAVLVPTTILAMQHYRTFTDRLSKFPVKIEYINRFKSTASIKKTLERVSSGETDILIGTHRIVNKDVKFKDLGLMVIDEEQKFGVKVKEKLKELRINVDSLTLTATPIPRTLHFSLMGARDLSIIATPPPNRQPITTKINTFNETLLRDIILFELRRGGQLFFVHNRIHDIEEIASIIMRLVPDARITVAHGQMKGDKLEKKMLSFIEGGYDILISTNIIESGLDIPNANTIIINHAHNFGLSDLHQMRGRVGRSNKKAFCYLLSPPTIGISSDARKRLTILEEFSELGDGFKVAMRDLDIRGAGNLLGAEQSGFISDLGFDMYHKILDETIQELKETEFSGLFDDKWDKKKTELVEDCVIESDLELIIPEDYVKNTAERLSLYSQLDSLKNSQALEKFEGELKDRFGSLPESVVELVRAVRFRWIAKELGFEKVMLKGGKLKGYFVSQEKEVYYTGSVFKKILSFVQHHPQRCQLKEIKSKLILIVEPVKTVNEGKNLFEAVLNEK